MTASTAQLAAAYYFLVFGALLAETSGAKTQPQQLLVISLDGFRYDYYDAYKERLPALTNIAVNGVQARDGISSVFTTKTFPAHWSLATGLYEESHGLISNGFYDPYLNETFTKRSSDRKWFGGEPIWVTARRQNRKVGVFYWIGSEVDYGDYLNPTERIAPYNKSVSLEWRIDKVINWLLDDRMDLVMMYWHEPDGAGHDFGPFTAPIAEQLTLINAQLERLLKALIARKRLDKINIVILGDHGMAQTVPAPNGSIYLDDYINCAEDLIFADEGPVSAVWPQRLKAPIVLDKLRAIKTHARVYSREEIPTRWHYSGHRRTPPILIVAEEGYVIQKNRESRAPNAGNHGYDNDLPCMRPLFFARGPAFKRNYQFKHTFDLTNLYPLACRILAIEPAPNNGSLDNVAHMLRGAANVKHSMPPVALVLLAFAIFFTL